MDFEQRLRQIKEIASRFSMIAAFLTFPQMDALSAAQLSECLVPAAPQNLTTYIKQTPIFDHSTGAIPSKDLSPTIIVLNWNSDPDAENYAVRLIIGNDPLSNKILTEPNIIINDLPTSHTEIPLNSITEDISGWAQNENSCGASQATGFNLRLPKIDNNPNPKPPVIN